MNQTDRARYALRVFALTLALGAGLLLAFDRAFPLEDDAEVVRVLFWSGVLALFAAFVSVSFAFVRTRFSRYGWVIATLVGAVTGIVFTNVALWRNGLWPGPLEAPVMPIWSFAAAVGFFVASLGRYPSASDADYSQFTVSSTGLLLAIAVVFGVKGGLGAIGEPMNFARYTHTRSEPHLAQRRVAARQQVLKQKCADSLDWRTVLDPDVAIDSSVSLEAAGIYASAGATSSPRVGRIVSLWSAGRRWFGVVETWYGNEVTRAMIENGYVDFSRDVASFVAPYADGFVDTFRGPVPARDSLGGVFRTADQNCLGRMLVNEPIYLPRNDLLSAGQARTVTLRDFSRHYAHAHKRAVRPSSGVPRKEVELPVVIAAPADSAEPSAALVISAHFASADALNRVLDPNVIVDVEKNVRLREATIARAVDGEHRSASWLVVLPRSAAVAYRASLERLRIDGVLRSLDSQLLPTEVR